jgi:hypothetical protein
VAKRTHIVMIFGAMTVIDGYVEIVHVLILVTMVMGMIITRVNRSGMDACIGAFAPGSWLSQG